MSTDPLQKNEIISRWKNKQTVRAIARDLGLGRFVVARVIHLYLKQTEPTESEIRAASFGNVPLTRKTKLEPYSDQLTQLLDRYPTLTALRAFEELRKLGFEGSYSTVRTYLKTHRVIPKTKTIRFETAPGAQAQMDWSTYHIDFTQEGRRRVELFSYILGYSRRQYICFTDRQDFEATVRQHIAAFEHLGGVAATCLYDNMKVVVTRWEDGQPIYNTRFLAFATHYGYKPWACQVHRPETKGKVERPFDYVEKNLLNGRTFRSLEHLNEVARWWLAEINDRRIHGTTKKTPLERHEEEKPHLIGLPQLRFDTAQVVYRIADVEGFINYANNRYSIPWQMIGQLLPVRIVEDELQIYNTTLDRIAIHVLLRGKNEKQSDPSHSPPKDNEEHISNLRERYTQWGKTGCDYFEGLLIKCRYGKHEAQRVLTLLHGYPKKDAMLAMERGIQYHAYGYQSLERILAHVGTPKAAWEILSQREQETLEKLTESTRVDVRRSEEYQQQLEMKNEEDGQQSPTEAPSKDVPQDPQSTEQSPREDPPVPGEPEDQNEHGAA
jgi:transposase